MFGLLFSAATAQGYPQFIGYKYSSCLTCHYNSHGNGPINDYGRAVWASEIAGRMFAGNKTAEQLGESSGFLGKKQMPWWIRPGVKARQLFVRTNPGVERNITMQADVNAAIFLDEDQKKTIVASVGYVPEPFRLQNSGEKVDTMISREHYFRYQMKDELWLSVGMMDKVYGIRHSDHTAFSRSRTGIAQNDQTHGLVAHYIGSNYEYAGHIFMGNLYQDSELRQKGASGMFEFDVREAFRVGTSVLMSSNSFVDHQRLAVHSKYGLGHGSALLFEMGLIKNSPKTGDSSQGYYIFSEAIQKVVRGYHIFANGQSYKSDMTSANPDVVRLGAGLQAFPMQRVELRIEVQNERLITNAATIAPDTWAFLAQLHLSL